MSVGGLHRRQRAGDEIEAKFIVRVSLVISYACARKPLTLRLDAPER